MTWFSDWLPPSLSLFPLSPRLLTQGAVIGIDDEDDSTFTITVDQKTFHFQGETYLFCLFLIPSLLYAGISSLSGHTRLHSSPVSLLRSFPAFKRLGLVDTNTRKCMHGHNVTDVAYRSFFAVDPLQALKWTATYFWGWTRIREEFNCNPESKPSNFFVSSLAFLAMAEEEDCFLCASADELRELNSAAAGRPLWMSLNDRIDSKLQPCLLHPSCLFFCVYLTRIWPVRCAADTFLFSPFDRFLTHLLQPLFVFVFHHLFLFFFSSLPTPNTPKSCLATLRPVFSLWDHPPQSMDRLPSHLPHAPSHVCVSKLHAVVLQAEG